MRTGASAAPAWLAMFAAVAGLAPDVLAAGIPEWATSTVDSAPSVPEGPAPYPSRVLLSEVRDEVRPDGAIETRRRLVTQALSADTDEVSIGWFVFEDTATLKKSSAWHIPMGKRTKKSRSMPVDMAYGDAFLSDTKLRAVNVEGVKKGSIVLFEFEAVDEPYILSRKHIFYEGAPVELARYQLVAPRGWSVDWAWLHHEGPAPRIEEGSWTWELSNLQSLENEPLGRSPVELAPWLIVNVIPPPDESVTPAVLPDWESFAVWYEDLVEGRTEVISVVTAAAEKVLESPGTGFSERILSFAGFVRDKVRYVDIELGIGAMQPRSAWDTLANLYGDCKDKGRLFQSLLATGGIKSYPVLVHSSLADTLDDRTPAWGFNHYVVAVPIPPAENVPAALAPAVTETENLGRLLIVDTTDEMNSIGSISSALAGKRALVVAGPLGGLITLPGARPEAHQSAHRIEIQLSPGGNLTFERRSFCTGEFAREARSAYSTSSRDRRSHIEGEILNTWLGAEVEDYQVEFETPRGEFVETVTWRLRIPHDSGVPARLGVFPGVREEIASVPLRRRKTDVDYRFPRTIRYEVIYRGLPASIALPAANRREGDGWHVETEYERDGDTVRASCEAVLSRVRFGPDQFPSLRSFWLALSASASKTLVLSE